MNGKLLSNGRVVILGCLFGASVIITGSAMADQSEDSIQRVQEFLEETGKGWKLNSLGGVSYVNHDDERFWFMLSGVMRFDETLFMGRYRDKQSDFPSSGNIRRIETYLDGGLGEDVEYTLGLNYQPAVGVRFGDTWVGYKGFMPNHEVFVGRISGNWFGLDNANSTSWNPFLERSSIANAFYPGDGLGVMTDYYWDNGGITLAAMQPEQTTKITTPEGKPYGRDRWSGTVRATFAPVHAPGDVYHMGISGAYREIKSTTADGVALPDLQYTVGVPAVARNTTSLLNTSTVIPAVSGSSAGLIRAKRAHMFNIEAARQCGPVLLEAEYTNVFVHRLGNVLGNLRFHGWNLQGRYLLTGEHHEYDVRDGNFGTVVPHSSNGAVELAARFDYINLGSKDIRGGSEHNATVGVNWFITQQVRLSANYIHADIRPASPNNNAFRRILDIVGMRLQVRFK